MHVILILLVKQLIDDDNLFPLTNYDIFEMYLKGSGGGGEERKDN